jgi:ZIP family zinc transporter
MSTLGWIVIITTIAGVGGTGIGGAIGAFFKKDSSKIVSLLLSFAAGVMLAVVCFDMVPNSFEPEGSDETISIWFVVLGIVLGYGIIFLFNYWIDKSTNHEVRHIDNSHPKTADDLDELIHADHYEEHKIQETMNQNDINSRYQLFLAGVVMACAIALHNLPEGIVIGATYAKDTTQIFSGSGLIIAIVIALHNIPEGMAVAVTLMAGGMKKGKAIILTAISGAPTIIGAIIGLELGLLSPLWLSLSLSFASGAMLYVVFGELLPEAILMFRSKLPAFFVMIGTLTGLILVNI